MSGLVFWIIGAIVGLIGLVGLFIARNAGSDTSYWAGLVLFVVAVLVEFWLIDRWFNQTEAQHPTAEPRP